MNFKFRLAVPDDFSTLMQLMNLTKSIVHPSEWFVCETEESLSSMISEHGFIIIAQPENPSDSNEVAGMFAIKFPGMTPDNLGRYQSFSEEQLQLCAHMESTIVHPQYRGYHLQAQMAQEAEELLEKLPYKYLFATIHPDNQYSMNNMILCGYRPVAQEKLYGGLDRIILLKEI